MLCVIMLRVIYTSIHNFIVIEDTVMLNPECHYAECHINTVMLRDVRRNVVCNAELHILLLC